MSLDDPAGTPNKTPVDPTEPLMPWLTKFRVDLEQWGEALKDSLKDSKGVNTDTDREALAISACVKALDKLPGAATTAASYGGSSDRPIERVLAYLAQRYKVDNPTR